MTHLKTYFQLLLLLFLPIVAAAQDRLNLDSLQAALAGMPEDSIKVGWLATLHEQLMFRDPEKAKSYARQEFDLARKIGFETGIATANLHFGNYFLNQNRLDSARIYYNRALDQFEENADVLGQIFANHSIAGIEKDGGNYDEALKVVGKNIRLYEEQDTLSSYFGNTLKLIGAEYELIGEIQMLRGNYSIALEETLKALKYFEQNGDRIRAGDALKQLGAIEYELNNQVTALDYSEKAFAVYKEFDDKYYQAEAAIQAGKAMLELERQPDAIGRLQSAIQLTETINASNLKAQALAVLGEVYLEQGRYKNAETTLKESLKLHQDLGYFKDVSNVLILLARVKRTANHPEQALIYLERALEIALDIVAKPNMSEAYLELSRIYEDLNRPEKALNYHKNHMSIKDSIFDLKKSQQIEELRTLYESEKNELEIAQQKNEIALLEQRQRTSSLQQALLISGLLATLLLSGLLFYGIRQKMKRNRLEKEKVDTELDFRKKELTTHALHLARKNELLENLKLKATELKVKEDAKGYQELISAINFDLKDDDNWENFSRYFEAVHKDFNSAIKSRFPGVSPNELRLMALIKMNLSSKEIANILNISADGIKKARQRLRKKLNLSPDESLETAVLSI